MITLIDDKDFTSVRRSIYVFSGVFLTFHWSEAHIFLPKFIAASDPTGSTPLEVGREFLYPIFGAILSYLSIRLFVGLSSEEESIEAWKRAWMLDHGTDFEKMSEALRDGLPALRRFLDTCQDPQGYAAEVDRSFKATAQEGDRITKKLDELLRLAESAEGRSFRTQELKQLQHEVKMFTNFIQSWDFTGQVKDLIEENTILAQGLEPFSLRSTSEFKKLYKVKYLRLKVLDFSFPLFVAFFCLIAIADTIWGLWC